MESVLIEGEGQRDARRARRRRAAVLAIIALASLGSGVVAGSRSDGGGAAPPPLRLPALGFRAHVVALAAQASAAIPRELALETRAVDRVLRQTPYVTVGGAGHREVALTFDDGPGPYTPHLLRVLRREGAPGTFFEVGEEMRYFHAATAEQLRLGFPVGNHTESHPFMARLPRRTQRQEIVDGTGSLHLYGVPHPHLYRPPYRSFDADTLRILHEQRMLMVLWSVDSRDYSRPGVKAIVHNVLSAVRPGAIVLMHDGGGDRSQTVAALPRIIHRLRARGYRLVTVPRLLLDDPPPRTQRLPPVGGA